MKGPHGPHNLKGHIIYKQNLDGHGCTPTKESGLETHGNPLGNATELPYASGLKQRLHQ